jgi:ferredoxin
MLKEGQGKVKITILPEKRGLLVTVDENLLNAARKNGLDVPSPCNDVGICGQCRVRFDQGASTPDLPSSYPLKTARNLKTFWKN